MNAKITCNHRSTLTLAMYSFTMKFCCRCLWKREAFSVLLAITNTPDARRSSLKRGRVKEDMELHSLRNRWGTYEQALGIFLQAAIQDVLLLKSYQRNFSKERHTLYMWKTYSTPAKKEEQPPKPNKQYAQHIQHTRTCTYQTHTIEGAAQSLGCHTEFLWRWRL